MTFGFWGSRNNELNDPPDSWGIVVGADELFTLGWAYKAKEAAKLKNLLKGVNVAIGLWFSNDDNKLLGITVTVGGGLGADFGSVYNVVTGQFV